LSLALRQEVIEDWENFTVRSFIIYALHHYYYYYYYYYYHHHHHHHHRHQIKKYKFGSYKHHTTDRLRMHFGPKTIRDRFDGSKDSDSSCSGWVSVANSWGYCDEHAVPQQLSVSQECLCFRSVSRPTLNRLMKSTRIFS
jgi:hypothetical protein